ncbi:hypothetical protein MLD38_039940 [Melastoma candidum]|uniref:Uncharacterized protein n=1 Tax=Melastoma candidum TaxID=119954 RepID=A0ACB9L450_9MYRT|nr:hypothetical protein MLD38_039940 [Melastoma candidum]
MGERRALVLFLVTARLVACGEVGLATPSVDYVSAVGDPGMRRDALRLALESWNQCNEVGEETQHMGSPRYADCFDVYGASPAPNEKDCSLCSLLPYVLVHRVTEEDNNLGVGNQIPGGHPDMISEVDAYAAVKELYLGAKCQVEDVPNPWHFWMIMLKNGNMDTFASMCPKNGQKAGPFGPDSSFPCFGKGCMNHPVVHHDYTTLQGPDLTTLRGRFFGTWDLDSDARLSADNGNSSFFSVTWEKQLGKGSWVFHHVLRTSSKYPWLMLYLRSDASSGLSGGYHYPTRGMSKIIPESPNFIVKFTLNVIKGGGPGSQFYLLDIGSCWKNDGRPCDGDVTSDITRYSEMIINPDTPAWCRSDSLGACPPYHTFPNGTIVHRNDTARFPYSAYHLYCSPGNARFPEAPSAPCDPYSNPQPQEILQILPHPVWSDYGYPTARGQGWVGQPRTWKLDVGRLSQSLYFYQDPGSPPAKRRWTSVDLGTEIFKQSGQVAEWTVSDFDILLTNIR